MPGDGDIVGPQHKPNRREAACRNAASRRGGPKVRWVEPIAGTLLMCLVLADVFLTVLYARAGTEIISNRLARLIWLALRRLASHRSNSQLLSFCGPLIVVALLLTWSILLALG